MNRREAMHGLAIMFGAELLLPIRTAVAQGIDPVDLSGATLFSEAMREQAAALAETIIPATDTPGAREAGVADFIEFMLQEWYPDEDRERFIDGMTRLQQLCQQRYQKQFADLGTDDQAEIVASLQNGQATNFEDGGQAFFLHVKQLTIFGYYTSEIGMTVERRYLPVPGQYDGDYPYENVGTLFTS
jgi:gluconate 2-dehydrogenase gamma chain